MLHQLIKLLQQQLIHHHHYKTNLINYSKHLLLKVTIPNNSIKNISTFLCTYDTN